MFVGYYDLRCLFTDCGCFGWVLICCYLVTAMLWFLWFVVLDFVVVFCRWVVCVGVDGGVC